MKCAVCQARKGKRVCQVHAGQEVCSACCGPLQAAACAGCSYYGGSQEYRERKSLRSGAYEALVDEALDDLVDDALSWAEDGEVKKARKQLERLLKQHPGYHNVLFGLGVCRMMAGDIEPAIEYFEHAVRVYPPLAQAHFNLAGCYVHQARLDKAVASLERVIEIEGEAGDIGGLARTKIIDLDRLLRRQGAGGLQAFLQGQRTYDQAFAALRHGELEAAIAGFGRVLDSQPEHVQSYGNLGLAYAGQGQRAKALEQLERALAIDPDYEPAKHHKKIVSGLAEGERLDLSRFTEIEFYRDKFMEERGR